MKVLVIMNRPLLDFDSSRSFFLSGLAATTKWGVEMNLLLPSLHIAPHSSQATILPLARSATYRDYVTYFRRLHVYSKRYLQSHPGSVVHQFKIASRGLDSFCLPAVSGLLKDHPLIIGPGETIHEFGQDDYKLYMNGGHALGNLEFRVMREANRLLLPVLADLFASTVDSCDYFIVAYNQAMDQYKSVVPHTKFRTISYGVNLGRFRFSAIPNNSSVLFVGNLVERKGVHVLIRAIAEVRRTLPNVMLNVIGDGAQRVRLQALVEKLGLASAVSFAGRVNADLLVQAYRNCRVFCQPSYSEGFCHVNLEAMASGRPVVATNTPGSSMITDGSEGYIIKPGDVSSMSEKILTLLQNYDLASKMGVYARKKVECNHDWNKIAAQYREMYASLV